MLNLLKALDADISGCCASRLPGEPADGIEDRHIDPVEWKQVRVSLR